MPKEVPVYIKSVGKRTYQILVTLKNVPGALAETASIIAKVPANVINGIGSVKGDRGTWTFFAESTDKGPSAELIKKKLVGSEYVLRAEVNEDDGGFLVDKLTFPINWSTGDRAVLMRMTYLAHMFDTIRRDFGSAGEVILYREGLDYGRSTWTNLLHEIGEEYARSHVPNVLKIYNAVGWGRVDVASYDEANRTATIRMEENFECLGHRSDNPRSQFVRGHLGGAVSVLLGADDLLCEETKCISKGDKFCEFQMRVQPPP